MSSKLLRLCLAVPTAALITIAGSSAGYAAQTEHCGRASWYAIPGPTASGETMNPKAMTAAHRSLPFGTKLKVVNPNNGRSVVVRINDRGPFIKGRELDLSLAAADKLGFRNAGVIKVCYAKV